MEFCKKYFLFQQLDDAEKSYAEEKKEEEEEEEDDGGLTYEENQYLCLSAVCSFRIIRKLNNKSLSCRNI